MVDREDIPIAAQGDCPGTGRRTRQPAARTDGSPAKPAVHFGGKFRIIDFALVELRQSQIRRIGVVTQYKSHSLLRHLQRGWNFLHGEVNEFVDLLPAQQRVDEESWYRGTADAVYQNIDILETYPAITRVRRDPGRRPCVQDELRGDAGRPCRERCRVHGCLHRGAAAAKPAASASWPSMKRGMITDFIEKPADPPAMPGNPDMSLCSMGVYVFNAKYLYAELARDINDPAVRAMISARTSFHAR
jgi:glucose-1-phosphate adenylyltransferase